MDGHVHLLDPQVLPYPWVAGTPLDRRFDAADLADIDAEVGEWVVVQADTTPPHAVDGVRWVTEQLGEVVGLVARHPEQHLVLDHLGEPAVGDPDAFAPWHRAMVALAAHPLVVELSGLASELVAGATLADAAPYVDAALELFWPGRCLYGSDWPVVTTGSSATAWRTLVGSALAGLDEAARAEVMGGTARRVHRRRVARDAVRRDGRRSEPQDATATNRRYSSARADSRVRGWWCSHCSNAPAGTGREMK